MSKEYLNTFAIISFNKNNIDKTLKYERLEDFIETQIDESEEESTNEISYQEIEYKYWIKLTSDKTYTIVKTDISNITNIDDAFAGPFDSVVELSGIAKMIGIYEDK